MNNNDLQTDQNQENNVDISFFGLNSMASWILFVVFIVAGIIFLPYLLSLFV